MLDVDNHSGSQRRAGTSNFQNAEDLSRGDGASYTLFVATCLRLVCDGISVGPTQDTIWIPEYEGKRAIDSLVCISLLLCKKFSAIEDHLVHRGQTLMDSMQSKYVFYTGQVLPDFGYGHRDTCSRCSQRGPTEEVSRYETGYSW